jgi:hypothetical protein
VGPLVARIFSCWRFQYCSSWALFARSSAVDRPTQLQVIESAVVSLGWLVWYATARPARRVPPSASLATDHSGLSRSRSSVTRPRSGLKWMCPRRQRESAGGCAAWLLTRLEELWLRHQRTVYRGWLFSSQKSANTLVSRYSNLPITRLPLVLYK